MLDLTRRHKTEPGGKRVILLEFVAASAIFFIMALVVFMVLTYKPS